ncbi:16S rRNA (cytosine(1402)-N(4))-methyltransferase RsmH [bacterium]|nr:16S rRNA (cytosine(1402)-N(4))-methyltransferase RsmH [bacterium]
MSEAVHFPVLKNEMLAALSPKAGGVYVDGTFGAGGYSRAILEHVDCTVIGIDRDPSTRKYADALEHEHKGKLVWLNGRFGEIKRLLDTQNIGQVDGIVLDIGVSSMQIDQAERGFSYKHDGPLDMRMGEGSASAAELVNNESEQALADMFYYYGEERLSRRVAKAIVEARTLAPITRTLQLAEIIGNAVPQKIRLDAISRCFQGLRIAANQELDELKAALAASLELLKPLGRLVVVTFHSLEDRIVKQFMASHCKPAAQNNRYLPAHEPEKPPLYRLITRSAVTAGEQELKLNNRSRSAKLRAMEYAPVSFGFPQTGGTHA